MACVVPTLAARVVTAVSRQAGAKDAEARIGQITQGMQVLETVKVDLAHELIELRMAEPTRPAHLEASLAAMELA